MSHHGEVATKHKASEQSYLTSLGSYVSGLSSYIPSGLKKQLTSTQPHDERDKVIWVGFDDYEKGGKSRFCLILSFVNGFQVWDLEDQPDHIHEVVSKREGAIKCGKFVQAPPLGTPAGRLSDKHPIIAIASAEEGTKTAVKLYSLREQEYINTMRFRSEVYTILCSKRMLVVALHDHIYGFDIVNMTKIFSRSYHPQDPQYLPQMRGHIRSPSSRVKPPAPSSLVALGPRWAAFPGKKVQSANDEEPANNTMDQLVEAAKYLSDLGYKTVSSYFSADSQPASSSAPALTPEDVANFGNVIVYDVLANKTIAHFRAHKEPLSYLSFDPSGTLLVTAGASGYEFNIFMIRPSSGPVEENVRHIYTLIRGRTSAAITNITFSNDSRWMAVSTSHGTSHIYAINPEGGPVNIHTHIPWEPIASHQAPIVFSRHQEPKHMSLNVVERVKQTGFVVEESSQGYPMTAAAFLSAPSQMKLMVINQMGILSQYNLLPHGPSPTEDNDPKTLQLTIEPTYYWDVCRRNHWRLKHGLDDGFDEKAVSAEKQKDLSWLSNVEITTHTPPERPLWAGPQFTFKTYRKPTQDPIGLAVAPDSEEIKIEGRFRPTSGPHSSGETKMWGAELEEGVPSSKSDTQIKDSITKAMSTLMHFPEKRTENTVLGGSLLNNYGNGVSKTSSPSSGPSHSSPSLPRADKKKNELNPTPLRIDPNPQPDFYDEADF